jgi:DNA-binding NtrC family response regulator
MEAEVFDLGPLEQILETSFNTLCSIEAERQATRGTMQSVAERLGLSRNSLMGHLNRAKQAQNEVLFDWKSERD